METILQSKTKPGHVDNYGKKSVGIKYNDNWHTVTGKAADYVEKLNFGQKIYVATNDSGDVVYISTTEERKDYPVDQQNLSELPVQNDNELLEKIDILMQQNATINEMLLKIMKHLNLAE